MKQTKLFFITLILTAVLSLSALAEECSLNIEAKNTASFIEQIPYINDNLALCPIALPNPAGSVYKNARFLVQITNDETSSDRSFQLQIKGGKISGMSTDITKFGANQYTATMSEADFDAILQSSDKAGTFAYLYKEKRIKIKSNKIFSTLRWWLTKPFLSMGMSKIQAPIVLQAPQTAEDIGEYPGYRVCDFYQTNKKLVTCGAYMNADTFCTQVMQHKDARAVKCEENGIVVCTLPCETTPAYIPPKSCAYDNARPRGSQAAPLEFCAAKTITTTSTKKDVGQVCIHGGECKTGNCVGEGQGPPWVYKCSCDPFKYTTTGCK